MSVSVPQLDSRTYQALLDDAMGRIPTHNPEWTNYNHSDPGITLLELFAFLTENLLYRANLIPERNRIKFLNLLRIPLSGAATASGLVTFSYDHGPSQLNPVDAGAQVRAGSVSFHTDAGVSVLPIEARAFVKQAVTDPPHSVQNQQRQLYASFAQPPSTPADFTLYETLPLDLTGGVAVAGTADGSVWIALLLRAADAAGAQGDLTSLLQGARQQIGGETLSLGFVPVVVDLGTSDLDPSTTAPPTGDAPLFVEAPVLPPGGQLPVVDGVPAPKYKPLDAHWPTGGLGAPGVVQVTLPKADDLELWSGVDPLMAGVGDLPPDLGGTDIGPRVITWLRLRAQPTAPTTILWLGINAAPITQRTHVSGEILPGGTGEPDQTVQLAHVPVIADSVVLTVSGPTTLTDNGSAPDAPWKQIDDLLAAAPEIPVPDPTLPPGTSRPLSGDSDVYTLDPTRGVITFGDGGRGARPPLGATISVEYDYGAGSAGNVGAGTIKTGIALPPGVTVINPFATWGGADAESVDEAAKQTARYLQHRDRLVTTADFEVIAYRTPGTNIGRVEVLAATNPDILPVTPGTAPGAVTVMVIPNSDPDHPNAPQPTPTLLEAVAAYLDPRRLITTQLFLRGPDYQGIWVSVGVDVAAGSSIADVTAGVKLALKQYLAPIDPTAPPWYEDPAFDASATFTHSSRGWPLQKPVIALELMAVANRVPGVDYVQPVMLAPDGGGAVDQIPMTGLQLPELLGISVVSGDPADLGTLSGGAATGGAGGETTGGTGTGTGGAGPLSPLIPVPVVPETC